MLRSISFYIVSVALFCGFSLSVQAESFKWFNELEEPSSQINQIVAYEDFIYAVGGSELAGSLVIKYRKDGSEVWKRWFKPNNAEFSSAASVTVTSDGIFIAGSYDPYVFVVKFTHSGERIWTYIDDSALEYGALFTIAHDNGGLYVAGTQYGGFVKAKSILTRLDFNGSEVWTKEVPIVQGGRVSGGLLLVNNGLIYTYSGYDNLIRLYDVDGNFVSAFQTSSPVESMVYFDGFIYTVEMYAPGVRDYLTGDYSVIRYDTAGNATILYEHSPPYPSSIDTDYGGNGIAVQDDSIYVLTWEYYVCCPGQSRALLTELNLNGQMLSETAYSDLDLSAYPHLSIAASGEQLFIGGTSQEYGFIADVSGEQSQVTAQIRPLDDYNSDGYQDIAVMIQGAFRPQMHIKSIGLTPQRTDVRYFDNIRQAADFQILSTQFDEHNPALTVLGKDKATINLRNTVSSSANPGRNIVFSSNISPIKFLQIPDQNSNSYLEIGVLGKLKNQDGVILEIRDSNTSELLGSASFNPNYTPVDIALVQDLDGDNVPEVGLLSSNEFSKIEIRSLTGTLIKNIWLGSAFNPSQLVSLSDTMGAGIMEATTLGVVQTKKNGNALVVKMLDPVSGSEVNYIGYDWHYKSVKALPIEDISSGAAAEIALLGQNTMSVNNSESTTSKVTVRDSSTGQLIKNVWQINDATPLDMTIIPDVNGNQAPEIVTVMDKQFRLQIYVKDSLTGQTIETLYIDKP